VLALGVLVGSGESAVDKEPKAAGEDKDDDDDEGKEKNNYSYGTYGVEIKYAFFDKDFNKIAEDIEEDDVNTSHDKYFIIHKGDSYKYYNMDGKEIYSE
jgi:hypothetical protein